MSKWWGQLTVYFGAEDKAQVNEFMDGIMDAASDVICGPDVGPDHECAFDWSAGGHIFDEETQTSRWKKEDAAVAMYAALEEVRNLTVEWAHESTGFARINEVVERVLLVADVDASQFLKKSAGRRKER
jgi:hypothetical protein